MNAGYPLLLDVSGRRVLVVGGGAVGARRALALAEAGAAVEVVAPLVVSEIAGDSRISVAARAYVSSDLDGAWLVHACTGVEAVDASIAADAERAGVWCVRASSAESSSAWTPAVARVDDMVVAVNAGADPRRATALRDAIRLLLETGELPVRRARSSVGRVALVGGGPGDPGLITVRGRRLLAEADVVIVDRLGPRSLLEELGSDVEVVEAGKARDNHTLPQGEINDLLISLARQGKFVVRLKGGDPFVFGRGGEEMLACVEAGIACEVVPGVTSAIAVPAVAGIPLTYRNAASQFTVVTAHDDLDWFKLADLDGTLVLLMGATRVERIAKQLVEAGRDAQTPVAVIENGTTDAERTTVGTLDTIGGLAGLVGVQAPAVLVVGEVAALHGVLALGGHPPHGREL
ncbi:MAG: uroporphyrin-III C-methyltransferase / precorrin-2 dehydrogenase / sirohydrochlorin ferrochelatase [Actinomycetota bacterium]|nr:uroporphyrin-III C-methyltransferase / precorrin-2 dehydrogenase / sirohydrochlorin ferrochelatase [Actinomycetota bacterium]